MARFTLYLLITLCSIKEITNFELIHQLFPHMTYQTQDGAALALVYYCFFFKIVITVVNIIMHIACLVIDCSFCSEMKLNNRLLEMNQPLERCNNGNLTPTQISAKYSSFTLQYKLLFFLKTFSAVFILHRHVISVIFFLWVSP